MTAAAELKAPTSFICVLLADIHQYVFLYGNFKATAKRFRDAEKAVDSNEDKAKTTGTDKMDPTKAAHVVVKDPSEASAVNYLREDSLGVCGRRRQL